MVQKRNGNNSINVAIAIWQSMRQKLNRLKTSRRPVGNGERPPALTAAAGS
jgi:hypothetical protein